MQRASRSTITTHEPLSARSSNVEIDCNDMQFFADEVEIFSDADRMRASGNVVFVSSEQPHRGRADGVQHARPGPARSTSPPASPSLRRTDGVDRSLFGTQEPDAYFWGETIEKLGPEDVPHHPRRLHDLRAADAALGAACRDSVTLTLDEHAMLKNAVLKVKGVPVFYLPVMYYPINKEDRATGFLIPIYGSSTIARPDAQQRVLLGDQPQPGRDVLPRLVLEDRPGLRRRVPLRRGAGSAGNCRTSRSSTSTTPIYQQPDGSETRPSRPAPATRSAATWCSSCPATCGSRPTPTTSPASARSSATSRNSTSDQQHAQLQRQPAGNWGRYSLSTHGRSQRDVQRTTTIWTSTGRRRA